MPPTCPTCKRYIPDGLLACLDCTTDRSRAALFDYQMAPLRQTAEEHGALVVRTVGATRHIQMFGYEVAFCNLLIPKTARRSRIDYGSKDVLGTCQNCQHELARALQAAFE